MRPDFRLYFGGNAMTTNRKPKTKRPLAPKTSAVPPAPPPKKRPALGDILTLKGSQT